MTNDKWTAKVKDIKEKAFRFFQKKFKEEWFSHPKLVNPDIKSTDMMEEIE